VKIIGDVPFLRKNGMKIIDGGSFLTENRQKMLGRDMHIFEIHKALMMFFKYILIL